ncbi:hypothetical protein BKA64DRAFT_117425 [Cadophora sp. MPI-SDFR-AT-0126]|nr:hypothetical protein BKA64DRAFT_117425 [Leotiomycetes sp. MPI-SDFR-AT-0126]
MDANSLADPYGESARLEVFRDVERQRRKHGLMETDLTWWRSFIYERSGVEMTVFCPKDMLVQEIIQIKAWKSLEDWAKALFTNLNSQTDEAHPFHRDPYTLHGITVESFNGRWMQIMADIRNSAGIHLPGLVDLVSPEATTGVGVMVTIVHKDTEDRDPWGTATKKYMLVTSLPRISAGQIDFLELPMGRLEADGRVRGITAWEEITRFLPIPPSLTLNMSDIAITGSAPGSPGLEQGSNFALGCPRNGELRGAIFNRYSYQHTQIMLYEYRMSTKEFNSLEDKLRIGYLEHRTGEHLPDNGTTLRLLRMGHVPSVNAKDINIILAWALYKNLEITQRIGFGHL